MVSVIINEVCCGDSPQLEIYRYPSARRSRTILENLSRDLLVVLNTSLSTKDQRILCIPFCFTSPFNVKREGLPQEGGSPSGGRQISVSLPL